MVKPESVLPDVLVKFPGCSELSPTFVRKFACRWVVLSYRKTCVRRSSKDANCTNMQQFIVRADEMSSTCSQEVLVENNSPQNTCEPMFLQLGRGKQESNRKLVESSHEADILRNILFKSLTSKAEKIVPRQCVFFFFNKKQQLTNGSNITGLAD